MIEIAVLVTPETTLSTVYGMNDLLSSPGRDWSFITQGQAGQQVFNISIVSVTGEAIATVNNGWVKPHRKLTDDYVPDAVCLLEFLVDPFQGIQGLYPKEIAWLQNYWHKGGIIGAACTGSLLLAEAGLLDDQGATTHWGFCDAMAKQYPKLKVKSNKTLITAGDQQRLIMVGGGASWMDLGLYLISKFIGSEEAIKVAKVHLIQWHETGQQAYAYLCSQRQYDDAIIADCQVWLANHYDQASPVSTVIQQSGLTERTFIRRFKNATGMTPIDYVLNLRIEEAKLILESSNHSIEAVSEMVGYQDASFFSRKFRQKVGLTPTQYRKKFVSLRSALSQV